MRGRARALGRGASLARGLPRPEWEEQKMQDEKSRDARYAQIASIDPERLAAFRAGLRRRYDDDEILAELRACADRLRRSPSMREFSMDPESTVHPQTVIDR